MPMEIAMFTLCIRYKFNPEKLSDVRQYFEEEQRVIERSGGRVVGYFLPTDFAGPNNEGIGLIDVPSMAAYEDYRGRLVEDPEHKKNAGRLADSGAEVVIDRSFIQRITARS
jgi:NIPSNAP protein